MPYQRINAILNRIGGASPAFRLTLLMLVGSSALAAMVPQSTIGFLLRDAPHFVGFAMCALAAVGVIETIINDILPEQFHWDYALNVRHLALMLCCGFYLVLVFELTQSEISNLALPYFLIMSGALAWHAFMDIRSRFGGGASD